MEQTISNPDAHGGLEKTLKEVINESHADGRDVNWKSFKDGIRLHQAGTAWAAAVAEGANSRPRSLARTISARSTQKHFPWGDEQDEAVAALLRRRRPAAAKEETKKTSLKALLAVGGEYSDDEEGERGGVGGDDEEEEDGEGESEGRMAHTCCACMVRHKGAAFIPCGHTFCRLCSRELRVSRGNCPLCNGFIHEILDIF